ncbi:hypothetical protein [Streptosporangium sp. KLBMP 9127]|nr:hypothetical protein [Streptosporangium sp. KLBMP 9127]
MSKSKVATFAAAVAAGLTLAALTGPPALAASAHLVGGNPSPVAVEAVIHSVNANLLTS